MCRPVLQLSQAELREVERKQRTLAATNQWSVRNRLKATLLRLPQPERRTRADLVDLAALASCACRFIAQHVCSLCPLKVRSQCWCAQARTLSCRALTRRCHPCGAACGAARCPLPHDDVQELQGSFERFVLRD